MAGHSVVQLAQTACHQLVCSQPLLHLDPCTYLQAAEELLLACAACGRSSLAAAYYSQLQGSGAAVPAVAHAAALRALLGEVQAADSETAAAQAAAGAVAQLEQEQAALLQLKDAQLAADALAAAVHCLRFPAGRSESLAGYRTAADVQAGSGSQAAAERLYGALCPPARLAAWGLRLAEAHSAGSANAQLTAVAAAVRGGGGQLLALLRLAPLWLPACTPAPEHWGAALAAAQRELESSGSEEARLIAAQLAAIYAELRKQAGDAWAAQLPAASKVGGAHALLQGLRTHCRAQLPHRPCFCLHAGCGAACG